MPTAVRLSPIHKVAAAVIVRKAEAAGSPDKRMDDLMEIGS
ncbi:hypothetical protein KL86PLE_10262 [uncultured Pleomorphomonas sp.]|uniref:Uncharacterized protein n=1 Tax=uncultured Pleomorphomonas sp. TaxID=442121 RepID=A0A212KZJ5_9HYPH|nr:hypothetical protein KL86PLE_10262 [uncultured Pleomorphomonas sp.]